MEPRRNVFLLALLLLMASAVVGCDSNDPDSGTFYGPEKTLGNGTLRAFVTTEGGKPTTLGLVLTEAALDGLAAHGASTVLTLPEKAGATLVQHIAVDWNPHGHPPEGLFNLPHFDFHFYMIPEAERLTWTPDNPDFVQKSTRRLEARYVPEKYIADPSGIAVPQMGFHWLDGSDPTYAPNGPVFTEVFIYGSYDAKLIFFEPMITKAYLESKPNHSEALAQPQSYQKTGYYPTRYSVRYDAAKKEYVVALEGLTLRTAG